VQIFTKNSNRWEEDRNWINNVQKFKDAIAASKIKFLVSHDSYLINLCANDEEILEHSRLAFLSEIKRCDMLGIEYLNFHPGAHMGRGEDEAIKYIAESLNIAIEKSPTSNTKLMLETTAGQGSNVGYRFEQLRRIIDLVDNKERVCVCVDTAHIFAAGYEFRNEAAYENLIREFNDVIGLDRLKCFHLNDSKKDLGSRVDRHEHIGKGFIGLEGFRFIMNDSRLTSIAKILETPKTKGQLEDLENLKVLKSLIKED
jgi:deoxyribonuclease-4